MAEAVTHIDRLEQTVKADWSNLRAARKLAAETRSDLRRRVSGFDSEDTSIVVFGSLARDEFTSGIDIDWTLLIDGSADPRHYDLTAKIRTEVRHVEAKQVGPEGMFSAMVFSHDLIHEIGGEDDTNRNTTRRLLLLLESCAAGREDAHRRVVRNILNRYLRRSGILEGIPLSSASVPSERLRPVLADDGSRLRIQVAEAIWARMGNPEHQAAHVAQDDLRFRAARVLSVPFRPHARTVESHGRRF